MSLFKDVNVVRYYVTNWEQAKKFYCEVLDWPVAFASDEVGWYEYGREHEAHLAINRWEGPEPVPARYDSVLAVLSVDDAKAVTTSLRVKGVKCDDIKEVPGMVVYGGFYDPEGNHIQFASNVSMG